MYLGKFTRDVPSDYEDHYWVKFQSNGDWLI